ncbi:Trihelix transcription factor A [Sesamum angolense]|uniref:Trihelix transcription factor A n=1 Tax=Sesamum angolense TaxID=2727404 RepID=A0AAE2BYN6_9LAMI|nr:Trihelix transcription factor A [Sesamum angolense]
MALEQLSLGPRPVDGGPDGRQVSGDGGAGGDEGSKAARLPRWTRQEILVLIQGKRVAETRVRRGRASGSAFGSSQIEPKWASVSSYCKRHGVNRGPVQCRKRWSNLAGDFKKIKEWESKIKEETESFWVMRNDLRRERKLPGFFDREVYDILDGGGGGGTGGGGGEEEVEVGGGLSLALAPAAAAGAAPEGGEEGSPRLCLIVGAARQWMMGCSRISSSRVRRKRVEVPVKLRRLLLRIYPPRLRFQLQRSSINQFPKSLLIKNEAPFASLFESSAIALKHNHYSISLFPSFEMSRQHQRTSICFYACCLHHVEYLPFGAWLVACKVFDLHLGTNNEKQAGSEAEVRNTQEGRKRKRYAVDGEGETTNLQHQLIEALEKNGKLLSSQLEAQNAHLQLDREQRSDHVNSLITVLNKLADALGRIADKL